MSTEATVGDWVRLFAAILPTDCKRPNSVLQLHAFAAFKRTLKIRAHPTTAACAHKPLVRLGPARKLPKPSLDARRTAFVLIRRLARALGPRERC